MMRFDSSDIRKDRFNCSRIEVEAKDKFLLGVHVEVSAFLFPLSFISSFLFLFLSFYFFVPLSSFFACTYSRCRKAPKEALKSHKNYETNYEPREYPSVYLSHI